MIPTIVLVSIGGGFGAATRFLVDGAVQKANGTGVPLGTAVVNATGSFLVGLVSSAVSAGLVGDEAASFATIGILGGGVYDVLDRLRRNGPPVARRHAAGCASPSRRGPCHVDLLHAGRARSGRGASLGHMAR